MPDDLHTLMPRRNPEDTDLGAIKADLEFLIERGASPSSSVWEQIKASEEKKYEVRYAASYLEGMSPLCCWRGGYRFSWGLPQDTGEYASRRQY